MGRFISSGTRAVNELFYNGKTSKQGTKWVFIDTITIAFWSLQIMKRSVLLLNR